MNICYLAPCFDYSGYGEANRHFIMALDTAGVEVQVEPVTYCIDTADFGKIGQRCRELVENKLEYRIKVLHITPDQYKKHMEPGKYHIGHLFWETSKLPKAFADGCNMMDEIWTGSETNAEAIRNSGVNVPVLVFPQPIEIDRPAQKPYTLMDTDPDTFVFYSIFEWSERKNPVALIQAYLQEFTNKENVVLLIKTYIGNFQPDKMRFIRTELRKLRARFGEGGARILLYPYLMDRSQIDRLHATGHAYVTAHRGEGWGIPIVEAMLSANPVITTGYNGVNEYLTPETAWVLPFQMVRVQNMERNSQWYEENQKWADVSVDDLRAAMREVYMKPEHAEAVGLRAQDFVIENFNFAAVGAKLKERLEVIERKLS